MKNPPKEVKERVAKSQRYFQNSLSEFIYYRSYSRWIENKGRRETWIETVDRYIKFMKEIVGSRLTEQEYEEISLAILKQEVMPSMRLLWSAGEAARASNVSAYNCAYIAPTQIDELAEIMYILMCGTGVGFSVESQCIQQLPIILHQTGEKLPIHRIEDTKEGWCNALKLGLNTWYEGKDISFNYSLLRPAGAKLQTMGGSSSGPGALQEVLGFIREKILAHQGRRLKNIDVYDIICKIGQAVVTGGVRRSALISLSDLDDLEMRSAKTGYFYLNHPQRVLTNNSTAYDIKPDSFQFLEEWIALIQSGAGERGIFNRGALLNQLPKRRLEIFKKDITLSGTNPCGEIILRSKQFCNLSEIIARPEDTEDTLLKKTRIATLIGTYQSLLTDFPYLSPDWRMKCEEERLLGVSITGQWDSPAVRDSQVLTKMRECALETNSHYSQRFKIRQATAITCIKPSGTVSLLVNSASGMHPRHSRYYLRRVRISAWDPIFLMLKDQGFPYVPETGQLKDQANTYVLEFPVSSPDNAITKEDLSVIDQLEYWKKVKLAYTEHNPSVTILIGKNEWIQAANWVYENWTYIGGLSFLPRSNTVYPLAPFEEITKELYEAKMAKMPSIDFSKIVLYEKKDQTTGSQALSCVGDACEIDPEEGSIGIGVPPSNRT